MSFTDEQIARVAWDAARALADVLDPDAPLGPWSSVHPDWAADEIKLVKAARYGATPEAIHEQRMQLDPELLPFDQLPPEDRAKDYLFAGVCTAMNAAGDVVARAENERLAIREALERTAALGSGNQPLGAEPIAIEVPQPPERA